jgi:hypothetical protein
MSEAALFTRLADDRVLPGHPARGPWSPDALHGGPVAALLGGAAEPLLEGLFPARATVELLRPVPLAPLAVTVRPIRPGRKVRLVGAELATEGGTVAATATLLGIRQEDTAVPAAAGGPTPPPAFDSVESVGRDAVSVSVDYDAFHNIGVEHRFVRGSFVEEGAATDWIRLAVPVVAGEPTTPLQRVLGAADFGNGISRVARFEELIFINPDLTVHLHRLPVGEWVCLDAASVLERHGVGLAQSELWDPQGRIGRSLQSLLVEGR